MSAPSIEWVHTPRLSCERLALEHAHELSGLMLDSRVLRTLWPREEPPTEADVISSVASKVDHWDRYGFGLWLIRDRRTGATVGRGGLQYTYAIGLNEVEAAWVIAPDRWGEGLATELAQAAVEAAFETLELPAIVALTLPENLASRRVMAKTGFTYERDIEYARLPHLVYRIRRHRW